MDGAKVLDQTQSEILWDITSKLTSGLQWPSQSPSELQSLNTKQ